MGALHIVVSASLTVRCMTVLQRALPKSSDRVASTVFDRFVCESHRFATTFGRMEWDVREQSVRIVSSSLCTPWSENRLISTGMSTACVARSALIVRRPRLGGQSIMH